MVYETRYHEIANARKEERERQIAAENPTIDQNDEQDEDDTTVSDSRCVHHITHVCGIPHQPSNPTSTENDSNLIKFSPTYSTLNLNLIPSNLS